MHNVTFDYKSYKIWWRGTKGGVWRRLLLVGVSGRPFQRRTQKLSMLDSKRDGVTKALDVEWECKRQSRKDGQETDRVGKNDGEQLPSDSKYSRKLLKALSIIWFIFLKFTLTAMWRMDCIE